MANTFSSLKRMRQTKRKTTVNRLRKSRLRHQIRSMRRLIEQNLAPAREERLVRFLFQALDHGVLGVDLENRLDRRHLLARLAQQPLQVAAGRVFVRHQTRG